MNPNVEERLVLDSFELRGYQEEIWDAVENHGYRKVLAVLPRRAGKDISTWNLAIRWCLRRTTSVFYCLPTYGQARKCIWDAISIDGKKFLDFIPKSLILRINQSEMQIVFKNNSILQLIGADSYATSLVGCNPSMIVFSEWARCSEEAYSFARPILAANNGLAIFLTCVVPDTLVITENGFKRIKDISSSRNEYTELNINIWGLGGFHNAEYFYYGGVQPTNKIIMENGYEIECTPVHKLWNGSDWIVSQNISIGDLFPVQYGQNIWGKGLDISSFVYKGRDTHTWKETHQHLDKDFFYLLGLIHADGNYTSSQVCVTNKNDKEIIGFLHNFGFRTRSDGIHHEYSSRRLCSFLEWLGFKHGAHNKIFPDKLFECTQEQFHAFLQGLFDGDGSSNCNPSKRGTVTIASVCLPFIKDLQNVLLNSGIVSSLRSKITAPTKKVNVWSKVYSLEITGHFAHIFYRDIGFRLTRKQDHYRFVPISCREESGNVYPVDTSRLVGYSLPKNIVTNPSRLTRRLIRKLNGKKPHPYLQELLSEKFFYSPVREIISGSSEVFDFVIPDTHSFFSNNTISHNTPLGKNHAWRMYETVKDLPDWFVTLKKTSEIHHISDETIEEEREQMSPELFAQEYECSWNRGIEGCVWGYDLEKMKQEGRINTVAYEPQMLTHLAMDIGVNDATTLVWFQTMADNSIIKVIDCYSNKGLGLDHYADIIQRKPYWNRMGKLFAPFDIKVREWGSGAVTRFEKARQLGLNLTVLDQLDLEDSIENVKTHFPKIWIDQTNCRSLVDALENYYREWDEKKQVYKRVPIHNWASDYASAVRYMCQGLHKTKKGLTPEDFDKAKAKALYGGNPSFPGMVPRPR